MRLLDGRLDKAIDLLEQAVASPPSDPDLLSDLAAAYLTRAARPRDPQPLDRLRALAVLGEALATGRASLEARYNWALALDRAALGNQAGEAFRTYLRLDPRSPWAGEARRHLQALVAPSEAALWAPVPAKLELAAGADRAAEIRRLVARFPQRAATYAEEVLLPRWAGAQQAGKLGQAARDLGLARALGGALRQTSGDGLLGDAVAAIDRALAQEDAAALAALVRGHLALADGLRLAKDKAPSYARALETLERSAAWLAEGQSPLSALAVVWAASSEVDLGRSLPALDRLAVLQGELVSGRYPGLSGDLLQVVGRANGRLGNLTASLAAYDSALHLFASAGEREKVAAVQFQIAENLRFQGERERAWVYRQRALHLGETVGSATTVHNTLLDSAEAALREDLPRVALLFQNEMVARDRSERDAVLEIESLLRRSRTWSRLGEVQPAAQDLEDARQLLARVSPSPLRDVLTYYLDLATAEVELQRTPAAALAPITAALDYRQARHDRALLPPLYLIRARVQLALGKDALGEADLAAGIAESEAQRERVLDAQLRVSYEDQARQVFAEMIRLQVRRGRDDRAFDYAEMARTRNLLETLPGRGERLAARTLSAEAVQRELPDDAALVEYAVEGDGTLAWVLRRHHLRRVSIELGSAALETRVERLRNALTAGDTGAERQSAELYDRLLRPLEGDLRGASTLIVAPDRALYRLPFAVLLRRETGRFLLEDRRVVEAPSATLYVKASLRARDLGRTPGESVLLAGAPVIDPQAFPDFATPAGAGAEVRQLAALYPGGDLLEGAGATKAAFLAAAPRHEIVHVATHTLLNADNPLLSAFLLSPGPAPGGGRDSGVLYVHEIYRLRFDRTRLVVLAGCDTAGGRISASEGVSSLARPFLAAGVPAVLASLWPVDDRSTAAVLVAFHRNLKAGQDPAQALRNAQLSMLHGADPVSRRPARWGSFVILGGE